MLEKASGKPAQTWKNKRVRMRIRRLSLNCINQWSDNPQAMASLSLLGFLNDLSITLCLGTAADGGNL